MLERPDDRKNNLTVDQALACIQRIEDAKTEHAVHAAIAIAAKKLTNEQQGKFQELAKIKAFDQLFFDTEAEEEDISYAIFDHNISELDDFKAIITNAKKQYQVKIQEFMKKAKGRNAAKKSGSTEPGAAAESQQIDEEFDVTELDF